MKFAIASVLILSQLFFQVDANTCDGIYPPTSRWIRNMTRGSEFIFYGTIVSVVDKDRGVQEIQFRIDKQLKGNFSGTATSQDWGPGYPVEVNETRVFFVNSDRSLISCSDYKYYFTDKGMQAEIRSAVKGT